MDQNLVYILHWVKDVLGSFWTPVLLAVVALSLVSLFLNRSK